ncbi:hypothetical protein ASE99_13480 [Serratia sp. Leaf51]|nr:hypothetical protein ASE99_13480 [Serratia sp. Leaf51]
MNNFVNKLKAKIKSNRYVELKKQRGMSLLEVIIVLGIIGTMAAVVVVLAQRAFTNKDITDLNDNTNSVRVATVAAFESSGSYPSAATTATALTDMASIKAATGSTAPMVATLVNLGQISMNEIKNGISGDFFTMQGIQLVKGATGPTRGFALVVNGLDQTECRSFLLQSGNQWDFVAVDTAAGGVDPAMPDSLSEPVTTTGATGVRRSLDTSGQVEITAATVVDSCEDSSDNAIILGSK